MLFGLIGFFSAVVAAGFRCKRYGLTRHEPAFIGVFGGLGLLAGGSLLFAITRLPVAWQIREVFFVNPLGYLQFLFGGIVFYGGLFGALFGVYAYSRFFKESFSVAMKLAVPVFPLAHFFMRIGCFMGGCCVGIPHAWGIAFPAPISGAPAGVPLLPVQLYEAAANLVIFAVLMLFTKKERHWLAPLALYAIMYATVRFFLEFIRYDAIRGEVLGISTSQFISLGIVFACLLAAAVPETRRLVFLEEARPGSA